MKFCSKLLRHSCRAPARIGIKPRFSVNTAAAAFGRNFSSDSDDKKTKLQEVMDYYAQYEKEYEKLAEAKVVEIPEEIDQPPLELPRGRTGVFDLPELVELLHQLKAVDICVIQIPPELKYVNHMIIAGCLSARHLNAMSENLYKFYKAKMGDVDPYVPVEGKSSKSWRAIDLGNIVLHLMDTETRERYDLETLWTVGPEFDDKSQPAETDALDHWASLLQSYDLSSPPKVPISKAEQRKAKG